jgi:60 kDa SS-A/Ro ribonucleoprotein
MYKWVTKPETALEGNNDAIVRLNASVIASKTKDVSQMVELIGKYDLPRETLNTELLNDVKVWKAMLDNGMPLTAMIRNLGKMTSIGLLSPNSAATLKVVETLTNVAFLKKARVHPISILVALKTYQQGHGEKGNLSWSPSSAVLEALNDAFYAAFDAIDSTGKRFYLGVDVSGSMSCGTIAGMTGITPRTAAAVMAMVTARVEKQKVIKGFSHNLVDIDISPRDSLETVISKMERIPMGGTDASLPIKDALKNKIPVDCFVTYTDNETWAGSQHTMEALKEYRQKMGIPAKLVVVGFTASPFTIGDPDDVSCLDVAGFDSATPNLIADFVVE